MKNKKEFMTVKLIKVCDICGKESKGYGNNSEPVTKGICCDKCNREYVLPAKLKSKENQ